VSFELLDPSPAGPAGPLSVGGFATVFCSLRDRRARASRIRPSIPIEQRRVGRIEPGKVTQTEAGRLPVAIRRSAAARFSARVVPAGRCDRKVPRDSALTARQSPAVRRRRPRRWPRLSDAFAPSGGEADAGSIPLQRAADVAQRYGPGVLCEAAAVSQRGLARLANAFCADALTHSEMALSPRSPVSRPHDRNAPDGRGVAPTMRRARTQSPARARGQSTPTRIA
jgi:hypothetical protein